MCVREIERVIIKAYCMQFRVGGHGCNTIVCMHRYVCVCVCVCVCVIA